MILREYQQKCVDIINGLEKGSYLISMATGLGKTVVFSAIQRKGRVLIISHREELVHQPIKYYDCPCGIEQGKETSHGEDVVSASVQSLIKRLEKFRPDDFDIIITDEAHHAAAPSYKKVYSYFTPRLHLGFTATPNRGDKVRLDDVFESIIYECNLKWGIKNGYLTDVKCFRAKVSWNLNKVKTSMGDFQVGSLEEAINRDGINTEVAEIYKKYARGQTLIFTASVSHAENIAKKIPGAVAVSQKTENRKKIIEDFTNKRFPCLVNCMIFTEGTDLPLIETVIIARPTKNQSLYTQMVGRGLRPYTGKPFLTLIDCVGVTDKLEICTAPSLLGLDMANIPKSRLKRVEGMLTEMPEIVDSAADCPENWVINVHTVQLFAEKEGVNLHSVNWTKKPNGDLVYQFSTGDRIGIKAINELGKTRIMYYLFDDEKMKFCYSESEEMSLQDASNQAYKFFCRFHSDERPLWDVDNYFAWQNTPATEKQIAYIKSMLSKEEFEAVEKTVPLKKGNCSQIINMLKIKNYGPKELLRLHRAAKEKEEQENARREEMSKMKIETVFVTKYRDRFYAIRHPNMLVITDSWDKASEIIAELEKDSGLRCAYKKFPSKAQAIDFLRS